MLRKFLHSPAFREESEKRWRLGRALSGRYRVRLSRKRESEFVLHRFVRDLRLERDLFNKRRNIKKRQ